MFFRVLRIRLKSYFLYIFYIWSTWILTSTTATMATANNLTLDCTHITTITSPGYPSLYQNGVFKKWNISAPRDRRILVTFNDFSLESDDFMYAIDVFVKKFTGENIQFPPYLAMGHNLRIVFSSSPLGRRKGFNISVSCHEPPPEDNVSARLIGGLTPSEGVLELSSSSGDWMRVCEESLPERAGEVICGELGYPGVKDITIVNGSCLSDDVPQNCTRAPRCGYDTYRLVDCTVRYSSCESEQGVNIKCHEPGYRGCYKLQTNQLQTSSRSGFSSVAHCINLCKTQGIKTIALINHMECVCSQSANVQLDDFPKCDSISESNVAIYDASVGFCDELNVMIGGSWDSNNTWFGSIIHLICMDGYTLKGNGTIQCVPGVTPYYPIWNDSIPGCEPIEGITETPSVPIRNVTTYTLGTVLLIIVIIIGFIFYKKQRSICLRRKSTFQQSHVRYTTRILHPIPVLQDPCQSGQETQIAQTEAMQHEVAIVHRGQAQTTLQHQEL